MPERLKPDPPLCNCLILCRDVLQSTATGQHVLNHVISRLEVEKVPCNIGPFVAYVRLHNLVEGHTLTLRFDYLDTNSTRFEMEAKFSGSPNPEDPHTLIARIPPFWVESAGRYILSALHEEEVITFAPIILVAQRDEESDGD